jgi:hypothetical protein
LDIYIPIHGLRSNGFLLGDRMEEVESILEGRDRAAERCKFEELGDVEHEQVELRQPEYQQQQQGRWQQERLGLWQ